MQKHNWIQENKLTLAGHAGKPLTLARTRSPRLNALFVFPPFAPRLRPGAMAPLETRPTTSDSDARSKPTNRTDQKSPRENAQRTTAAATDAVVPATGIGDSVGREWGPMCFTAFGLWRQVAVAEREGIEAVGERERREEGELWIVGKNKLGNRQYGNYGNFGYYKLIY